MQNAIQFIHVTVFCALKLKQNKTTTAKCDVCFCCCCCYCFRLLARANAVQFIIQTCELTRFQIKCRVCECARVLYFARALLLNHLFSLRPIEVYCGNTWLAYHLVYWCAILCAAHCSLVQNQFFYITKEHNRFNDRINSIWYVVTAM